VSAYRGRRVALLTQHHKERVLGPALAELGAAVEVVGGFDTDTLGTFTREIPRFGTQLEAARRKARVGMARSGLSVGLGSEGAFGPDPFGILPWNVEVVVLVDDVHGVEVVGRAAGPALHEHDHVDSLAALERFAERVDFPAHGLVLRPDGPDGAPILKGLVDLEGLRAAWAEGVAASRGGRVFVEHDLRAHVHPSRMARIAEAAADLVARVGSACPACAAPGFWAVARVEGLECEACGLPTREARGERRGCVRCDHVEETLWSDAPPADPALCGFCNP
jgi:Zn ribbon nucleic-acid-binding protein